jgi:hypothetical protein
MFDLIGETASIVRIADLTNDMMFGATALIHTPQLICATFGTLKAGERTCSLPSALNFREKQDTLSLTPKMR